MTVKELWNPNRRKVIDESIEFLLSKKLESGWPMNFEMETYFRSIASMSLVDLDMHGVMHVLQFMNPSASSLIDEFEETYARLVLEATKRRAADGKVFQFILPLDVDFDEGADRSWSTVVLGFKFTISPWRNCYRMLGIKPNLANLNVLIKEIHPNFPNGGVAVRAIGVDWMAAWNQVEPAFSALRGIIEFTHQKGRTSISMPSRVKSWIPHPPWLLAKCPDGRIEALGYMVEPLDHWRKNRISVKSIEAVKFNSRLIKRRGADDSISSMFCAALRLYADALDQRLSHRQLLVLLCHISK